MRICKQGGRWWQSRASRVWGPTRRRGLRACPQIVQSTGGDTTCCPPNPQMVPHTQASVPSLATLPVVAVPGQAPAPERLVGRCLPIGC